MPREIIYLWLYIFIGVFVAGIVAYNTKNTTSTQTDSNETKLGCTVVVLWPVYVVIYGVVIAISVAKFLLIVTVFVTTFPIRIVGTIGYLSAKFVDKVLTKLKGKRKRIPLPPINK